MAADGDPLDNGVFETQTLNVGQADARVSITEEGEIILVDANTEKVAEELDAVLAERATPRTADGKTPIDHLVVTHLHDDHVKGIDSLQDGYEIQHVIEPDDSRYEICDPETGKLDGGVGENVIKTYTNALEKHNVETISQVSAGEEMFPDSNINATVLGPPDTDETVDVTRAATGAKVNFKAIQANENGAVFKLKGERSALFMGDVQDDSHHHAESWLIQQHDDPESDVDLDTDVVFIGHHGSGNATSKEYLERADPDIAVISSELNGQYNHPHDEVLKNLHKHDVDMYWTAAHGTTRTDLDDALTTDHTEDLDTTTAADLAVVKHYCKENEITPEAIDPFDADALPEDTPDWATDASSLIVDHAAAEQTGDVTSETTTATEETPRSGRSGGAGIADTINALNEDDIIEGATTEMGGTEMMDDNSKDSPLGAEIADEINDLGPGDFPDEVDIEDVMQSHADAMRDKDDQIKDLDDPGTQGM